MNPITCVAIRHPVVLLLALIWNVQPGAFGDSRTQAAPIDAVRVPYEVNPEALWKLKELPFDVTFKTLKRASSLGGVVDKTPQRVRAAEIASEILYRHPDLEGYLTRKLGEMNRILTNARTTPDGIHAREYPSAMIDHINYLAFASYLPGKQAFRIVGSFLSSPYFPPVNMGDYTLTSPASHARGFLAELVKERLNETIPEDIEGARKWWHDNEQRFQEKPASLPAAVAFDAETLSSSEDSSHKPANADTSPPQPEPVLPQAQRTPVQTTHSPFFGWFFGTVALMAGLIGGAVWAVRPR